MVIVANQKVRDTIFATCPNCHALVRRWVFIPFVFFRTVCVCGAPLCIQHPRITDEYVRTARRCLDCGDPIAPVSQRGRVAKTVDPRPRPRPWICESCRARHRRDEPGTDLDYEIRAWLRGQAPVTPTASRRL